MSTTNVNDAEHFTKLISKGYSVTHFWAEWCAPCKDMDKFLEQLAQKHKNVDAEKLDTLTDKYSITAVPTFLICSDGKLLAKVEGVDPSTLAQKVDQLCKPTSLPTDFNETLKKLINMAPITLFMKGTADAPRCGFSRQMVEILRKHKVQFAYFDILTDNQVREGLKKYSNWPTYPQLYVKGKLIGGLDVVKELEEEGELLDALKVD